MVATSSVLSFPCWATAIEIHSVVWRSHTKPRLCGFPGRDLKQGTLGAPRVLEASEKMACLEPCAAPLFTARAWGVVTVTCVECLLRTSYFNTHSSLSWEKPCRLPKVPQWVSENRVAAEGWYVHHKGGSLFLLSFSLFFFLGGGAVLRSLWDFS